jgi:signal transduction histidine kinase
MRLASLYRTTSFRLALIFLALFSLTSFVLFAFIDWEVRGFLSDKVDEWILREGRGRARLDLETLIRQLDNRQRSELDNERPIALYGADKLRVAGTAIPFPAQHEGATEPFNFGADSGLSRAPFRGLMWKLPSGHTLLVSQSLSDLREFHEVLFGAMLVAGGFTALFGLTGAVFIGMGAVRQLDAITLATRRIVAGDLTGRLPEAGARGDVGRLVSVVNEMLDEIERLMREVKGVCDNIAHDLRTPLTRLLAGLDRVRRRSSSVDDYAAGVDDAIAETQGVLKTFGALLRISEVEDGARRAGFVTVDLADVLTDAIEFYEPLADEKDISLSFNRDGQQPYTIPGDPSLLFEAFANLIDNAIKFSPQRGRVDVKLTRDGAGTAVSVEDTGPGILEADRENVLRRFYRAEPSRNQPGNGLGLSLVAAIARLHGMEVQIEAVPGCRLTLRHKKDG